MDALSIKNGDCIVEVLETFLYDGVKVLKKVVDTIEKIDTIPCKENGEEDRVNKDVISQVNKDIAHLCQLITLSRSEYANLHASNVKIVEEIELLKNVIGKCALRSIVERDFRNIESEFKLKQNKIVETITRIEVDTETQVEKIFQDLSQLREEVSKMDVADCRVLKIEERLDMLTNDVIRTDEEVIWMKELLGEDVTEF